MLRDLINGIILESIGRWQIFLRNEIGLDYIQELYESGMSPYSIAEFLGFGGNKSLINTIRSELINKGINIRNKKDAATEDKYKRFIHTKQKKLERYLKTLEMIKSRK